MADQFCRITCANICNMTMNGDGIVCLVTTDANTSYVIRDIYKEDEAPTSPTQCYRGDLYMDGVKVASNLSASLTGNLIVPPSSVLCYRENSGNYPMKFGIVKAQVGGSANHPESYLFCCALMVGNSAGVHCKCCGCCGCFCLSSMCCDNCWYCGTANYDPGFASAYAAHYYDGNSVSQFFIFFKQPNCTSYTLCYNCYTNYCTTAIAPDLGVTSMSSCSKVHNWRACNWSGLSCFICVCNFNAQGRSTYGKNGVSMVGCRGCCACRAAFEMAQSGGTLNLYYFNTCCVCSGNLNMICSWCLGCWSIGQLTAVPCFCNVLSNLSGAKLGVFWSCYCNEWMPYAQYFRCLAIANSDMSKEWFLCAGPDFADTAMFRATDDGKRFWWWLNCSCKHAFIDFDAMIRGSTDISYLSDTPYTTGNWCYPCCLSGHVFVSPACNIPTYANSCDYPAIDCDTKIRVYGIKST